MLEYGLDEPIVAFVLDGTGLGDDGKVWGGEIFLCDRREYNDFHIWNMYRFPAGVRLRPNLGAWRLPIYGIIMEMKYLFLPVLRKG